MILGSSCQLGQLRASSDLVNGGEDSGCEAVQKDGWGEEQRGAEHEHGERGEEELANGLIDEDDCPVQLLD